jgi:hypothetical protein
MKRPRGKRPDPRRLAALANAAALDSLAALVASDPARGARAVRRLATLAQARVPKSGSTPNTSEGRERARARPDKPEDRDL